MSARHRRLPWRSFALGAVALFALSPALAAASGGHAAFADALLALALILFGAKIGGDVAARMGQPAVLGELLVGVVLGNASLVGLHIGDTLSHDAFVASLAELGVVLLLFEVGLESTVAQMARVGASATLVAILGVVAPMVLGIGVGLVFLPDASFYVHLFLGATLCATSVGITARVLKDLGQSQSNEARVILGAAVVDDVLGLVVLAGVSGLIEAADRGVAPTAGPVLWLASKAVLFLGAALAIGVAATPFLFRNAARLRGNGVLLGFSLAFCFALSYLASLVGLAPIVGAFAAGLVLEAAHYKPFVERGDEPLEKLIHPVVTFIAPVFFVSMGLKVDLASFMDPSVLGVAAALTVAAILGKQACSLGVLDKAVRRLPVGIGMIPRGEVGLIFANIGLGLQIAGEPIVSPALFSAVVVMVIVTTFVSPPLLAWSFRGPRPAGQPTG